MDVLEPASNYISALIVERWVEIAMGGVGVAIYRWLMGRRYRRMNDRIEVLEKAVRRDPSEISTSSPPDNSTDYIVLDYWGETGNPFKDIVAAGSGKRYPKTIIIRKTGELVDLPYPPAANKLPDQS